MLFKMDKMNVDLILGREEYTEFIDSTVQLVPILESKINLITGAKGSIGEGLIKFFDQYKIPYYATDIEDLNVVDSDLVTEKFNSMKPSMVFHLAGAKHAPEGEVSPYDTFLTNTLGTINILNACIRNNAKMVLASTCKAADPETAYGASKLMAEKIVLNNNQTVARFYNVIQTSGNVFEIWNNLTDEERMVVTKCHRFFITIDEAIALILWSSIMGSGRWTINPGISRSMARIVQDLYPARSVNLISPRRGDRLVEPRNAACEKIVPVKFPLEKIVSVHD